MKSLKRRFDFLAMKNPGWSSYVCFGQAIKGCGFSKKVLRRWLHKLVDKDDYAGVNKEEVLSHFDNLNKQAEEGISEGYFAPQTE